MIQCLLKEKKRMYLHKPEKIMKYPAFIKPGDTIGLVAPSFGAVIEPYATRLAAAIRRFEARGYHVKTARSVYLSDGLGISTNPKDAAKDVMDFYLDEEVDAVISVGGGELMNETISHLDFDVLRQAKPKWYLGYSDNSHYLFPMAVLGGIAGIYGPCATGFGKEWEKTELDAFSILEGKACDFSGYDLYERPDDDTRSENPLAPYHLTEETCLRIFLPSNGKMVPYEEVSSAERKKELPSDGGIHIEGMLLGGCLDVLINLSGTRYDGTKEFLAAEGKPVIWFLEACDLSPLSIRRAVWHLRNCGWFENAAGFLIGRPLATYGVDMMGVNQYNAVADVLEDLQLPIVMDAPFGHVPPMMPLILGSHADVYADPHHFRVVMKCGAEEHGF